MALLSILGLYNYDPTIFDGLTLPTAADITDEAEKVADPWIPDKSEFINLLCMECAEMELVYPSAAAMSTMISIWSASRFQTWKALYNTMLYKYNPIWNKDGYYKEVRTPDLETEDKYNVKDMKTDHTGEVQHDVTGYDVNAYSPNTRDVNVQVADIVNGDSSNTRTETGTDTIERFESGNIGVTMTQEMIRQQREIVQFNLYEFIASDFKKQFCIMTY